MGLLAQKAHFDSIYAKSGTVHTAGAGLPDTVAVAIAMGQALLALLAVSRPRQAFDLELDLVQPLAAGRGAAAQTRMVSVAKIRLDRRKSTRLFKGIICDDISEFESHMPSHAVGICGPCLGCGLMRKSGRQ